MARRPVTAPTPRTDTSAPVARGLAAIERGDFAGAIEHFAEVVRREPESAGAHNDLANACKFAWRLDDAIGHYQRALALDPGMAAPWHNLGITLLDAARAGEAVVALRRALALRPGHVDTVLTLIQAHQRAGTLGEVAPLLELLAEQARVAGTPGAAASLALGYAHFERIGEAVAILETVVAGAPRDFDALRFLGLLLVQEARYADALARFEQGLVVRPDSAEARFYRAVELLRAGRLEEGFAEYEWRWRNPLFTSPRLHAELPAWDGEPMPGKTILLYTEQGLGDSIQFVRFAPLVRARAGRVVLECEAELALLFGGCAGIDEVHVRGESLPACDARAPLMSLPHLLGTADALPSRAPYISTSHPSPRAPRSGRPAIGLVWAGSPNHVNDAKRSASLALYRDFLVGSGARFVSLQKGPAAKELEAHADLGLDDAGARAVDLQDTARVIQGLDLVITVDTAIAHLAGALGTPVWLLLPFDADWRWLTGRDDTPWYSGMRLFRQSRPRDWSDVMSSVRAALLSLAPPQEVNSMPTTKQPAGEPDRSDFRAGVRAHQQQEFAEAERLYRRAIAAEPALPEPINNLGALLAHLGRVAEAEPLLVEAVRLRPDYGEALNNLGILVSGRGGHEEAASLFRRANASDPKRVEWWNNLGNVYLELLRLDDALEAYDRALSIDPQYLFALNNRAAALRGLARYDEALEALRRALEIDPDYVEAINNLGLVHRDRGDGVAALACQRRALELSPNTLDVRVNLGITLQEGGDSERAREVAREILALDPSSHDAHDIFGHCAYDDGDLRGSLEHFRAAVALNPEDVTAQWNIALIQLHHGEFEQGLPAFEWRKRLISFVPNRRPTERPEWDGSPLEGRSVMIFSEQGIGDALQFIRYAAGLKAAGAGAVYVECDPGVKRLLRTVPGVDDTFARDETLPDFDLHVYVMSLPGLLRTTVATIPAPIPYLSATPTDLSRTIREGKGLKVGIVWGGNPEFKRDTRRSLHFSAIEHLAEIPGVQLYSLQVGAPAAQLAASRYRDRIIDLGSEFARRGRDMTETAAAIAELDLVISTCTSVPHLSGALGAPTWVMLPHVPDWRWLLERPDSPWYPSLRLFRQPRTDDWAPVIAELTARLRVLAGAEPFPAHADHSPADARIPGELRAFLEDHLHAGDVFLDLGRDAGPAAIAAASLAGRPVRALAVVGDPERAERLLAAVATRPLVGTVDVATADPGSIPVDDLAQRALRTSRGSAVVRIGEAGRLADLLPAMARLIGTSRLAAIVWPWRAGSQADAITIGGLAAFGFSHFRVREGDGGPEMFPFEAADGDGLVFTLSIGYLAATLAEQPSAARPEAAPTPARRSHAPRLGFDWQISNHSGWGVYGLNLALHCVASGKAIPRPLAEPDLSGLDPLQRHLLDAALADPRAGEPDLVLRALGNGLTGAGGPPADGKAEVGVVFFEDTHLDSAALARGRRLDRIIAGSTWNGEVLRAHGLTNVEVRLQGIDPTIFHTAPRTGWLGDRFVVFSGGKLEYRKGQDLVVAAFREFHRRHPDSLLMVAWHNHWPQTMAEIPLRGHVQGVPAVQRDGRLELGAWLVGNGIPAGAFLDLGLAPNSQMGRLVREADVALFPNRCEGGTNLVAMESMASGVPTILSANTGHLDLVRDSDCFALRRQSSAVASAQFRGVDGWGESSIEEMVETLEQIYTDRAEALQRARAASERMRGFAWSNQIDGLLDSLSDFLSLTPIEG
jgi:tetratricopeptide (TPR) repeat protein/glycosyltransferase involved in cell wall biosynthesis